jgi:hypothetical protein
VGRPEWWAGRVTNTHYRLARDTLIRTDSTRPGLWAVHPCEPKWGQAARQRNIGFAVGLRKIGVGVAGRKRSAEMGSESRPVFPVLSEGRRLPPSAKVYHVLMACAEYARLFKAGVEVMIAEDRARDVPARSMAERARLAMRDAAHSKVVIAEAAFNMHIRDCDTCKRDGRTPVNWTVGQF